MLDYLLKVMPPLNPPRETPAPGQWIAVENRLQTALPDDYKAYIERYGTGVIGNELCILNPFSANKYQEFFHQGTMFLEAFRNFREDGFEDSLDLVLFPEPGGLLPCGFTNNSHTLWWRTAPSPANWTIVVAELRNNSQEAYPVALTEFLAQLLTGTIKSQILVAPPFQFAAPFRYEEVFQDDTE